ncbi:hypothetical protein T484DRAFT_1785966 [Baffinella frigidus]|nr:hypothetical protein T484DRAFT_1785966 [Cryptophyta sp. CCMP2293]
MSPSRGVCWRGDDCNFSHDPSTAATPGAAATFGAAGGGAGGGIPLRCFLKAESRPLLDEKAVRNFVRALSACEDQVEVISGLGKAGGKGQEHLREICDWVHGFATSPGSQRQLSFQRAVVPLLRVVTHKDFVGSTLSEVNIVYATMHGCDGFEEQLIKCLQDITRTKRVADGNSAYQTEEEWGPITWIDGGAVRRRLDDARRYPPESAVGGAVRRRLDDALRYLNDTVEREDTRQVLVVTQ